MTTTWKEVWEARTLDSTCGSVLSRLMAADGLDTGFGSVTEQAWRRFTHRTAAAAGITSNSSVFEVGCGAGAYLFELYRSGCKVGGLDASSTLIGYARETMPNGDWQHADATQLDSSNKFDFVVACGVFLYFPSLDYARMVLKQMVAKAQHGMMILDVPDLAKKEACIQFRKRVTGEEAYAQKYDQLVHLYFDKAWIRETLLTLGIERIHIEDQQIEGYANSAFRYNIFAWPSRLTGSVISGRP